MKIKIISIISILTLIFYNNVSCQSNKNDEIKLLISTNKGDIKIKLYNQTPKHRDNFVKLVNQKFYDSLLFHRVINSFMIQGGDPDSKKNIRGQILGNGDVGYTIGAEFKNSIIHKKGAIAAARTGDNINPKKASSGCQFYIVQGRKLTDAELDMIEQRTGNKYTIEQREIYKSIGGTPHLDNNYTVFGEVIEGLDVIDIIALVKCDQNNRPIDDVIIKSITIIK